MDSSGLAAFCVTCLYLTPSLIMVFTHGNVFNRWRKENILWHFFADRFILCHHLIMRRIADNQSMWFLVLHYEAVNTRQISTRPTTEGTTSLFLWLCQMFSWVPHGWGESSHLTRTWCPTHVTASGRAVSADVQPSAGALLHLWKCSLAFHNREFPLLLFPLWFSVIYEHSSGRKGYPPQVSISLHDISWLAAEQQFWNVFTARQNPSGREEKCQKTHIRGGYKGGQASRWGKESLTLKSRVQEKEHRALGAKEWGQMFENVLHKNAGRYWGEG